MNDTVIQYDFHKNDLRNIRVYIITLEKYKKISDINEGIIKTQDNEINTLKLINNNQKVIIGNQEKQTVEYKDMTDALIKDLVKYKKRSDRWPYWLGGGFLGGILTCVLIK